MFLEQTRQLYLANTRLKNSHTNSDRLPSSRIRSSRSHRLTSFISCSPRSTTRTCNSSPALSFAASITFHTRCTNGSSVSARASEAAWTLFTIFDTPNRRLDSSIEISFPTTTKILLLSNALHTHASLHANKYTPSCDSETAEQGSRSGITIYPSFSCPHSGFASSRRYKRGYSALRTVSAEPV